MSDLGDAARPGPCSNRLLGALPAAEFRSLEASLQFVRLPLRKLLYEPDGQMAHVYFPTGGIVSLLYADESGMTSELAVVGSEGMVGLGALLGGHSMSIRALVQVEGHAYRMPAHAARARFAAGGVFQQLALKFAYTVLLELAQTAVCNLHHSVEQHLCRWLLACLDRLQGNEIRMTHELIAAMLGVRRQGVTEAARKLQRGHVIAYRRGHITVLDRAALERCACRCYHALRMQSGGILGFRPRQG